MAKPKKNAHGRMPPPPKSVPKQHGRMPGNPQRVRPQHGRKPIKPRADPSGHCCPLMAAYGAARRGRWPLARRYAAWSVRLLVAKVV